MEELDLLKKYMPEIKNSVTLEEIVKECEKNEISLGTRWLRYNITHGLLNKPNRIGRQAYYEKDYIYLAITCIVMLRQQFHLGLKRRKQIMTANNGSEKKLLTNLRTFLDKYSCLVAGTNPSHYPLLEMKFLELVGEGNFDIDFEKTEKEAIEVHEKSAG